MNNKSQKHHGNNFHLDIKKVISFLLLLIGFIAPFAVYPQKIKNFNPGIKTVTVYPDRALVTRSALIRMKPGKYSLIFKQASPSLNPNSLRAFSKDSAFIVQGISSHVERKLQTVDPKLRKLEGEKETLEQKKEEQNNILKRSRRDLKGINAYYLYLSKAISEQSSFKTGQVGGPGKWKTARTFLRKRRLVTKNEIRKAEKKIRILNEKMQIVNKKIYKIKAARSKTRRNVEISLLVKKGKMARVGFSYMIRGASWKVSYGMYLKNDDSVNVEYYGNIQQKTGENWKNVVLNLSTSSPSLGAQRPVLRPVSVRGRITNTKQVIIQKNEEVRSGEKETKKSDDRKPSTGADGFATLKDTGASLVFNIKMLTNIPSGRRSHRVKVAKFNVKPESLYYRIIAQQKLAAYLAAKLPNEQSFPLLAGSTDIFRKSGFIGTSSIRYTPSGSRFLVGFGVERNIRVKRKVHHYSQKGRVFSSERIYRTRITVNISNPGAEIRKVSIFERIPVSELSEIKVKILDDTRSGFTREKKGSGILRWNFTMQPGEEKKIELHYSVTVPKKYPIHPYGK